MALAKATIHNLQTGEQIPVMFNPEEYSLDLGNTFAEIGIPGLKTPPIQYVRGNIRTLQMELFFDTYEQGRDVRLETRRITTLLDKDATSQAPPILLFAWGGLTFQCVLESAGQRFTMFRQDGIPVRATLTVAFKEYQAAVVEIQQGLFFGPPTVRNLAESTARRVDELVTNLIEPTVHQVIEGEGLSKIAGELLGDPGAWREIAELNNLDNPFQLTPGALLIIPKRKTSRPR